MKENNQHQFKENDAGSYDAVVDYFDKYTERFTNHMPDAMLRLAVVPESGKVLDVGTGTGIVALDVASKIEGAGKVVGIDLSDGMLATAKNKSKQRGLDEKTDFLKMDAEHLEFDNASFDAVVSLYALRHFPRPDLSVNEMYRVLKPGARVVVAVGSPPSLISVDGVKSAFRRVAAEIRRSTGRELNACDLIDFLVEEYIPVKKDREIAEWVEHQHEFSGSIKQLVKKAGFKSVKGSWKGQYSIVESPEDFWLLQMTFSSIARKRIQDADEDLVIKIKDDFYKRCEKVLKKKGRLVYQTGAAIVVGVKP